MSSKPKSDHLFLAESYSELYYQHANDTFSPILSATRIYYFTKGNKVKPFPTGLKMISGSAVSKNLLDTKAFGVRISCDEEEAGYWLPNGTSHPGGCSTIAMATYFPSCGLESGDLDSDDHFSHMTWPQSYNGSVLVKMIPTVNTVRILIPSNIPLSLRNLTIILMTISLGVMMNALWYSQTGTAAVTPIMRISSMM